MARGPSRADVGDEPPGMTADPRPRRPPEPTSGPAHRWWAAALSGLVSGAVTVGARRAARRRAHRHRPGRWSAQPGRSPSATRSSTAPPARSRTSPSAPSVRTTRSCCSGRSGSCCSCWRRGRHRRRPPAGRAGLGLVLLLGLVAMAAVLTRPSASPLDVVPTVSAPRAGLVDVALADRAGHPADRTTVRPAGWSRRTFLGGAGAAGAAAVVAGGAGHVVESGLGSVEDSRADGAAAASPSSARRRAEGRPARRSTASRPGDRQRRRSTGSTPRCAVPQVTTDELVAHGSTAWSTRRSR